MALFFWTPSLQYGGVFFQRGEVMAKIRRVKASVNGRRPERIKLTAEESRKRMEDFEKRKEDFIAFVRKGTRRGIYS
jgi:hypothetical protein